MVTIKGSIKIQVEENMVPVHDIPFSPFGNIFSPRAMHSSLYFVIDNGNSVEKSQCFGGKNINFRRGRGISFLQGCGSGSEKDPDSIGQVYPDSYPYSEYGSRSGSRRAKMTH
jgi:hypothetical protein